MLDILFLTGQAASALLLLYGGYLAVSYWIATSLVPAWRVREDAASTARPSAL